MARTWPVSRKRVAALKIVDVVGRFASSPFRRRRRDEPPKFERVLVIEPWNIGDVVLATPLLVALRSRFPRARIALLGRDYARDLLAGSGLVDQVIVADLPWTAQHHKYRLTPAIARNLGRLIRRIRAEQFDVVFDSRMDIRSNLVAALSGAPRRIGYSIGGGGWLITDYLPSDRDGSHKIDDWLALLLLVDPAAASGPPTRIRPKLLTGLAEKKAAAEALAKVAGTGHPTIGYHPGGSHPGKRWPPDRFRELITKLQGSIGGRHIVFLGPGDSDPGNWPAGVTVMRPSLREFMAQVTCCDVLVCNDSGPMHIADALDVAVVAIFEVGNPQWFGPSGPRSRVVLGESAGIGMSAAPLDRPPRNPIPVARVVDAVASAINASPHGVATN